MRAVKTMILMLGIVLALAGQSRAQMENETTRWLYQQLAGAWQGKAGGQPVKPAMGSGPRQTSFTHQGAGVFRVHSSEAGTLLARWNGRQVRVTGPVSTDASGWTYFQIAGQPSRIGQQRNGWKVLEVNFNDRASAVELVQR